MSPAVSATLADLLPEDVEGLGEQIREHLGKRAPAIGWSFVQTQATERLREALRKIDLWEQLAQAWVTIDRLRAYRDPAHAPAGETAVVPLGKHRLGFSAKPVLRLKVGELNLPELKLTYAARAAFDHATLSILDGALVAVAPGDCVFSLELKCGEKPVRPPWTIATIKPPPEVAFSPAWKIP